MKFQQPLIRAGTIMVTLALLLIPLGESVRVQALNNAMTEVDSSLSLTVLAQQAYLKASNTGAGDRFGHKIAVSGDTVAIGAYQEASNATGVNGDENDNSASEAGAVYVFVRNGSDWVQQAYLKASNTNAGDRFGSLLAIDGDTIVVGAYQEDSNATGVNGDESNNSAADSGAVYVFTRSGATWSQQAYLKASNAEAGDLFGVAVAIDGDTIIAGARGEASSATGVNGDENNNSATLAGAAYVFTRSGTTWSQQAYLKASNTGASDLFGNGVDIDADTIVIGATYEDSSATGVNGDGSNNSAYDSGAAYIFVRNGSTWFQQAYLKPSNTNARDVFGSGYVSIDGDTVVAGAPGEDSSATGVNGDQSNNSASISGAAYVFTRSGSTWSQQAYLKASNSEAGDQFGSGVSISGDTIVVGAIDEDSNATGVNGDENDNSASQSGAAYVFTRNGTTWSQQTYLKTSNTDAGDNFGPFLSIDGNTIVIGAYQEDSSATGVNGDENDNSASNAGAAYVFGTGLAAPTNFYAVAASSTQIDLNWTDNSDDETLFSIERSADGGSTWTELVNAAADATSYSDSNVTCEHSYSYRVRAYRSADDVYSDYSNIASATTDACPAFDAPSDLSAAGVSSTQVDLSWTDNSDVETSFHIEHSQGGINWTEIAVVGADATSHSLTVSCDRASYYRVRAYRDDIDAYTGYSNVVSAITHACPESDSFYENFDDGNTTQDPGWWAEYCTDDFSVSGGVLHADGNVCDSSGTAQTRLHTNVNIPVGDYLEISFVGMLKPQVYPNQAGIGARMFTGNPAGGYYLIIGRGDMGSFPINENAISLVGGPSGTIYNIIDTSFPPEYGQTYKVRAVRSDGTWTLYVDDTEIGTAADTVGTDSLTHVALPLIGSVTMDNLAVITTRPPEPLVAPSDLSAAVVSTTQIDLSWADNSNDENSFHLERSEDGGSSWAEIGSTAADVTSYSDIGVICGTAYSYRVRGYRDLDATYSDYSNIASGSTVCNAPPVVDAGGPYSGSEGSAIGMSSATASDPDEDPLSYSWSVDSAACIFDDAGLLNPNLTCYDIGDFTATLTVSDGVNPPVSDGATVTVVDITPPIVTVPPDQEVLSSVPIAVNYPPASATDTHPPEPAVSCSPASGEIFPLGDTTVTCTASDTSGNVGEASFVVSVLTTEAVIGDVLADIDVLLNDPGVSDKAKDKLSKARDMLYDALDKLAQGDVKQGLKTAGNAVNELLKAAGEGVDVSALIDLLVESARTTAQDAINAAVAAGGKQKEIDHAQEWMSTALEDLAIGRPEKAVDDYGSAWDHAQKAVK